MSNDAEPVVVDQEGGLLLDPSNELKFKGPFDDYVSVSLAIKNPTRKRIAFKIKTTAPKRYCVKPNSGVLDPSQSMKVNVLLQPFTYDPNEKNKHKFMVQYMYLNESEMHLTVNDILNVWKDIPNTRLLDLKLKCIFEFTETEQQRLSQLTPQNANESGIQTNSNRTSVSNQSSASSTSSTAKSDYQEQTKSVSAPGTTGSTKSNSTHYADMSSHSTDPFKQKEDQTHNDFDSKSTVSSVSSVNNVVVGAKLDKNDNLVNELKLVKQENDNLKREVNRLKEEEARLRKLALQSSPSSSARNLQQPAGLDDLLNNRLSIVVFVLIAIIAYLILFR